LAEHRVNRMLKKLKVSVNGKHWLFSPPNNKIQTMKKIATMAVLFVAALTFSCSSDDDGGNNNNNDELFMNYKVNGVAHSYDETQMSTLRTLNTLMISLGDEADNFRSLRLFVPNDKTEGTHTVTYAPSDVDAYQASYGTEDLSVDGTSGTINITHIDADFIEGTFNFTGVDGSTGDTYTITDGEFRADNVTE
jgi:hypothetical protein